MRKIAIINQKGGCGKTTTAINLSACLAESGKNVLLIDFDPQAHATIGLGVSTDKLEKTLLDVLCDPEQFSLKDLIITVSENFDLVPSHIILSAVEQKLSGLYGREDRLRSSIENVQKSYDYIIVDCPPNIGLLTFNAIKTCNEAIVPIEASIFSLHGLANLLETIEMVRSEQNHFINIKALATMVDMRTNFSKEVIKNIKEHFGSNFYTTMIRFTVKLKEAASYGLPISQYSRLSIGNQDYAGLASELIAEEEVEQIAETADYQFQYEGPKMVDNGVLFTLKAPHNANVLIVGDFNEWTPDKGIMTYEKKEQIWKKVFPLLPGKYQYKFLVNGKWIIDPTNPNAQENDFGDKNSVIHVS